MILDSPFTDLSNVMKEIAKKRTQLPSLVIEGVVMLLKRKIKETLDKDIFEKDVS